MGRRWLLQGGVLAALVAAPVPAHAAGDEEETESVPAEAPEPDVEDPDARDSMLDWWEAWAHVVRLDVAPGRSAGRDLGAGGFGLQWEWWPTPLLSYTARGWMQAIEVDSDQPDTPPASREATGMSMGLQVGTPGKLRVLGGAGVGIAFVNGRLPPSDRWRLRPNPLSGVLEAHAGVALMARPVTLHAFGWVHLYSQGPAVFSLSFGGGPMLRPARRTDDGIRQPLFESR